MKFYVTIENIQQLKKSFLNLKLFYIIYVPDILEEYGYTYSTIDEYGSFIISNKINELIKSYSKSKRMRGIVYSNSNISEDLILNLYDVLSKIDTISEVVLMDDYNVPKLEHLYHLFDEIIFFPTIKRVRLIECQKITYMKDIEWKK